MVVQLEAELPRRWRAAEKRIHEGDVLVVFFRSFENLVEAFALADGFLAILEHADEARDLARVVEIAVVLASGGASLGALDARRHVRREP